MPSVEKLMREIADQQRYLTEISEVFSKQYLDLFKELTPRLNTVLPKLDVPKVELADLVPKFEPPLSAVLSLVPKADVPALKLDYSALFPDVAAINAAALRALKPSLDFVHDLQRNQFADLIAAVRKAVLASLPPNWRDETISVPKNLEQLLLDEGLPLAWVPPPAIVARIFAASTPQERRKIIGQSWKRIAKACIAQIDKVESTRLQSHAGFARKAAQALLDGSPESSQALSANLLDSILRDEFSHGDRSTITGQKNRLNIRDYPLRVAIVLGAIWGAHGQYWPEKGEKVPRRFSRHGSVHGVSRRQYSRVNAVLALMHVTALLRLLDTDLA